jgi:GT2 family glycosyltransferase
VKIRAGILHYRYWPGVSSTIDTVLAQTRRPDEIVVLDHASGDGSAQKIRETYPQVIVIEAEENRGPAVGEQMLVQHLLSEECDAILILPDDIDLAPDALETLAARLEADPTLGGVGPIVAHQNRPDRIFYAGGFIRRHNWALHLLHEPEDLAAWKGREPHEVDFLETGGVLLRAEAARPVGVGAEHFYYFLDDVDYTMMIAAQGWRLECVPAAVAWQTLGEPGPSPYIQTRNRLGLIARNAPRRLLLRELVRTVYLLVKDAIKPPDGSRADLRQRLRGLVDFSLGRWGAPPSFEDSHRLKS